MALNNFIYHLNNFEISYHYQSLILNFVMLDLNNHHHMMYLRISKLNKIEYQK